MPKLNIEEVQLCEGAIKKDKVMDILRNLIKLSGIV